MSLNLENIANEWKNCAQKLQEYDGTEDRDPQLDPVIADQLLVKFQELSDKITATNTKSNSNDLNELYNCIRCMSNGVAAFGDQARSKFIDSFPSFEKFLEIPKIWLISAAFIMNMCLGNDSARQITVDSGMLTHFVQDYKLYADRRELVSQILAVLAEEEDVGEKFLNIILKSNFIEIFMDQFFEENSEEQAELLENLLSQKEFQREFVERKFFKNLISFIDSRRIGMEQNSLNRMAKIIAIVSSNDELMRTLLEEFAVIWLSWLNSFDPSNDIFVSQVLISLGNVARSDKNCIDLINQPYDTLSKIVPLISHNSMNIKHSALSLLKNLLIPKQNKQAIFDKIPDMASLLQGNLDSPASPIVAASIAILKQLSSSTAIASRIYESITSEKHPIVFRLIEISLAADEEAVKYESMRLVFAWLKASEEMRMLVIMELRQNIGEFDKFLQAVKPFISDSSFDILIFEGICALSMVLADLEQTFETIDRETLRKIQESLNYMLQPMFKYIKDSNSEDNLRKAASLCSFFAFKIIIIGSDTAAKNSNLDEWKELVKKDEKLFPNASELLNVLESLS